MESKRSNATLHRVTYPDPQLYGVMVMRNFLSHDECDQLLAESESWDTGPAKVYMRADGTDEREEHDVRKGEVRHLLNPENKYDWFHNIILDAANRYKDSYPNSHPIFPEAPIIVVEIACYKTQGDHFAHHQDTYIKNSQWFQKYPNIESKNKIRKLSMSCILNDDFTGGHLAFQTSERSMLPLKLYKGDIVVFPSYSLHKVEPLVEGERYAMVSWILGPGYR